MARQAGVKVMKGVSWRGYRCKSCGALLFKAELPFGARVEIVCYKRDCKRPNVIRVTEAGRLEREEGFIYVHVSGDVVGK